MAKVFFIFFYTLYVDGFSIKDSYEKATSSCTPRNAYRWISKLKKNIPKITTYLKGDLSFHSKERHIQAFKDLLKVYPDEPFCDFQFIHQVEVFTIA